MIHLLFTIFFLAAFGLIVVGLREIFSPKDDLESLGGRKEFFDSDLPLKMRFLSRRGK